MLLSLCTAALLLSTTFQDGDSTDLHQTLQHICHCLVCATGVFTFLKGFGQPRCKHMLAHKNLGPSQHLAQVGVASAEVAAWQTSVGSLRFTSDLVHNSASGAGQAPDTTLVDQLQRRPQGSSEDSVESCFSRCCFLNYLYHHHRLWRSGYASAVVVIVLDGFSEL